MPRGRPRKNPPREVAKADPEMVPDGYIETLTEKDKKEDPKKKKKEGLLIPMLHTKIVNIIVRNKPGSPLVTHNWSEKAIQMMLQKQMGMPTSKKMKTPKNPDEDFIDSLYWLSEKPRDNDPSSVNNGVFGFKSLAFKNAAIAACRSLDSVPMTQARQWFHVWGTENRSFVTLRDYKGNPAIPVCRRDMVRVQTTTDIRFRGEFPEWQAELAIEYNTGAIQLEHIINLINLAGFGVGVGEQRPDRNGAWGLFEVVIGERR